MPPASATSNVPENVSKTASEAALVCGCARTPAATQRSPNTQAQAAVRLKGKIIMASGCLLRQTVFIAFQASVASKCASEVRLTYK